MDRLRGLIGKVNWLRLWAWFYTDCAVARQGDGRRDVGSEKLDSRRNWHSQFQHNLTSNLSPLTSQKGWVRSFGFTSKLLTHPFCGLICKLIHIKPRYRFTLIVLLGECELSQIIQDCMRSDVDTYIDLIAIYNK